MVVRLFSWMRASRRQGFRLFLPLAMLAAGVNGQDAPRGGAGAQPLLPLPVVQTESGAKRADRTQGLSVILASMEAAREQLRLAFAMKEYARVQSLCDEIQQQFPQETTIGFYREAARLAVIESKASKDAHRPYPRLETGKPVIPPTEFAPLIPSAAAAPPAKASPAGATAPTAAATPSRHAQTLLESVSAAKPAPTPAAERLLAAVATPAPLIRPTQFMTPMASSLSAKLWNKQWLNYYIGGAILAVALLVLLTIVFARRRGPALEEELVSGPRSSRVLPLKGAEPSASPSVFKELSEEPVPEGFLATPAELEFEEHPGGATTTYKLKSENRPESDLWLQPVMDRPAPPAVPPPPKPEAAASAEAPNEPPDLSVFSFTPNEAIEFATDQEGTFQISRPVAEEPSTPLLEPPSLAVPPLDDSNGGFLMADARDFKFEGELDSDNEIEMDDLLVPLPDSPGPTKNPPKPPEDMSVLKPHAEDADLPAFSLFDPPTPSVPPPAVAPAEAAALSPLLETHLGGPSPIGTQAGGFATLRPMMPEEMLEPGEPTPELSRTQPIGSDLNAETELPPASAAEVTRTSWQDPGDAPTEVSPDGAPLTTPAETDNEIQAFHPDETVTVHWDRASADEPKPLDRQSETVRELQAELPGSTVANQGEDLFEQEYHQGLADFEAGQWGGAVHHLSIAAALRPESHEVKERLREARRRRKGDMESYR